MKKLLAVIILSIFTIQSAGVDSTLYALRYPLSEDALRPVAAVLSGQGKIDAALRRETITPNKKVSAVERIDLPSGINIQKRWMIEKIVEEPLIEACQILFDKGIIVTNTSANRINVGWFAYIKLDTESLSEENKSIAQRVCKGPTKDEIQIPIPYDMPIENISKEAVAFAMQFLDQKSNNVRNLSAIMPDSINKVIPAPKTSSAGEGKQDNALVPKSSSSGSSINEEFRSAARGFAGKNPSLDFESMPFEEKIRSMLWYSKIYNINVYARDMGSSALPALRNLLKTETDSRVRETLIESIGMVGDDGCLGLLKELVCGPSFTDAKAALSAIGKIGGDAARESLLHFDHTLSDVRHNDTEAQQDIARIALIQAFVVNGDEAAREYVLSRYIKKIGSFTAPAIKAFIDSGSIDIQTLSEIQKLGNSESFWVRFYVEEASSMLTYDRSVEITKQLVQNTRRDNKISRSIDSAA